MKKILLILFIPLIAFSFETYKVNNVSVVYQKSDGLYDFVSIIVNKGYVNSSDCNALMHIADFVRDSSIDAEIKCYPDYSVIKMFSRSGSAVNALLKLRRSLDDRIYMSGYEGFDLLDIAVLERYGYSIKNFKSDKTFEAGSFLSDSKMTVFIESSADKKDINSILKTFETGKLSNEKRNNAKLNGEYFLGAIPSDIYFYDYQGLKDFNFHMYLVLLYSLNSSFSAADIRSVGEEKSLVSTVDAVKTADREAFEKAKKNIDNDIDISKNNVLELVYKLNFLFRENNKYEFEGLRKKINALKYEDYEKFVLSLKAALIFRKAQKAEEVSNFEVSNLKNNITLLYRNKKKTGSEIAVAFKDILITEKMYSKMFASDMIFMDLQRRFSNWRSEMVLPRSNLRIYSLKTSDSDMMHLVSDFIANTAKLDINNIRNKEFQNEIISKSLFVNASLNKDFMTDSSFMLLTDGEYRMAANKLFSGCNIVIAVESPIEKKIIEEALESISLPNCPQTKKTINNGAEDPNQYIEFAFNLKNKYFNEANNIETVNEMPVGIEEMRSPYYKLANYNKSNILAIVSHIMFSDANYLISQIR